MFEAVKSKLNFLKSLTANDILFEIYSKDNDIRTRILDLNRIDQLFDQGVNSENTLIGVYSIATEIISKGRKQAGTHFTFKDTGDFFRSFRLIALRDGFEIVADGQKDDEDILEKYDNLLGLTQDSKDKLVRELIIKVQEVIKFRLNAA